ncbi:Uncharacterised protein [Mycobacteroides abscessus subsp. abscessus]|uniref:hypothetical protein n=1 Tax=Mycobacteroides abscessus TaxID=36809 RepID=UPI00092CD233|nr:hypothetical protein [Mycobacteroides abscessus]MBE5451631.1 hypothetical protein [Mycobacteroides abscessus]MBE5466768.1 hypothetical protein [Mycobacteroides abscessus]MDM2342408.1 hypothetical protein [Mycobacteroides abscessus]SHO95333.1 Uncharacterised protein [Mycobacteroides abscessus subsp. abscessus]SHP20170.1 Uncharacterised protein [Mycobacteroides abscessus subsp. abscessus]
MSERYSLSRDPERDYRDRSEFGVGPGLVRPGKGSAPIRKGGAYRGKCPPVELIPSDDLSVWARETRWRRGEPPRGYPGERVG